MTLCLVMNTVYSSDIIHLAFIITRKLKFEMSCHLMEGGLIVGAFYFREYAIYISSFDCICVPDITILMDYRRAQRNLGLLNGDTPRDVNEIALNNGFDLSPVNTINGSISPQKSLAGTQIPDIGLSSDRDAADSDIENDVYSNSDSGQLHSSQATLAREDNSVFINTQIQSRLDDADQASAFKSQLNSFKYSLGESRSLSSTNNNNEKKRLRSPQKNRTSKRRSVVRNIISDHINSKNDRTKNLLQHLSGKYNKIKDIIKVPDGKIKKIPTRAKPKEFDTYNTEEWRQLKCMLLEKFPSSNNEDFNDVYKYLYGKDNKENITNANSYDTENTQNLWSASQQQIPLSQVASESNYKNINPITLISLSQAMEDTSANNIRTFGSDEENRKDHSGSNEHISILEDSNTITKDVQETNEESLITTQPYVGNSKDCRTVEHMSRPCGNILKNVPILVEYSTDEDDNIEYSSKKGILDDDNMISDSMDEVGTIIPIGENLEPSPAKLNTIIDLTQESFKAVNSLISPVKTDLSPIKKNQEEEISRKDALSLARTNSIQVPATRMPTLNNASNDNISEKNRLPSHHDARRQCVNEEEEVKPMPRYSHEPCGQYMIDKIQLNCLEGKDMPFFISSTIECFNSEDKNDQMIIFDNEDSESELVNPDTIIVNFAPNMYENNDLSNGRVPEALASQSAQDLRKCIKDIGLKPLRSKLQMIESLEYASQVLSIKEQPTQGTKIETFNYLTKLTKESSPSFMEKIYTFQAIPLQDLINQLREQDPFVEQIHELTIKEWADSNGISIRS